MKPQTEVKHTPTPWYFEESKLNGKPTGEALWLTHNVEEGDTTSHLLIHKTGGKPIEQARQDTAYIVLAVNAYSKVEKVISKIARKNSEEATEYFLRAVNAHEELVERLNEMLHAIDYEHGLCGEQGCRLCRAHYAATIALAKAGADAGTSEGKE